MTIPANSKQCSACGGVIPEESPLCPMCPDPRIANLESELAHARAEIERLKLQSEHADCWWNDDNRVGCPEEYADEEALKVGEEFELLAAAYWPTKYRVTQARDHETDEGEYICEPIEGRREEFETYFQMKAERDTLRAENERLTNTLTVERDAFQNMQKQRDAAREQVEQMGRLINLNESGISAVMAAIEGKRRAEAQLEQMGRPVTDEELQKFALHAVDLVQPARRVPALLIENVNLLLAARARLLQPTKVEERVTVEYVSASDEFGWKVFKDRTESGLFRDQENAEIYRLGLIAKLKGQNK